MPVHAYDADELWQLLTEWESELRGDGKQPSTIFTYTDRSRKFLKWVEERQQRRYGIKQLRQLLGEWEEELRADGKTRSTVFTYTDRSGRFLDWMERRSRRAS
jgi:hypothetical protein